MGKKLEGRYRLVDNLYRCNCKNFEKNAILKAEITDKKKGNLITNNGECLNLRVIKDSWHRGGSLKLA